MSHSKQPDIKVIFKVIPLTDDNDPDGGRRQRQLEAIVALLARAAKRQRASPAFAEIDDDRAYRAMDVLASADAEGKVQEAVFFSVADLLSLEVDLLFFDTTSSYFEIEDEDEAEAKDAEPLRRFGRSRDRRPDRPRS